MALLGISQFLLGISQFSENKTTQGGIDDAFAMAKNFLLVDMRTFLCLSGQLERVSIELLLGWMDMIMLVSMLDNCMTGAPETTGVCIELEDLWQFIFPIWRM